MNNGPLVSIIINNFNYAQFLEAAIASALNQSYTNIEVIVVDDGSTDESREIIQSYGDRLIPVFKENGGQASTFNAGFAASQGEIICMLDSDDVFEPDKVAKIVDIFTADDDVDWCFHAVKLQDKRQGKYSKVTQETETGSTRKCDLRQAMKQGRSKFLAPPTSGLCFRKSLLELILPMPEDFKRGADRYVVAIAPALSQGFYLKDQLTIQVIHQNNGNTLQQGEKFARRRAYKALAVAYYMRIKLPEFYKTTDRIFARGLGLYWKARYQRSKEKELITKYLALNKLPEKVKIYSMAIYHNLPWQKIKLAIQSIKQTTSKQVVCKTKVL